MNNQELKRREKSLLSKGKNRKLAPFLEKLMKERVSLAILSECRTGEYELFIDLLGYIPRNCIIYTDIEMSKQQQNIVLGDMSRHVKKLENLNTLETDNYVFIPYDMHDKKTLELAYASNLEHLYCTLTRYKKESIEEIIKRVRKQYVASGRNKPITNFVEIVITLDKFKEREEGYISKIEEVRYKEGVCYINTLIEYDEEVGDYEVVSRLSYDFERKHTKEGYNDLDTLLKQI